MISSAKRFILIALSPDDTYRNARHACCVSDYGAGINKRLIALYHHSSLKYKGIQGRIIYLYLII